MEKEKTPKEMTLEERMKRGINHHGDPRKAKRTISKKEDRRIMAEARLPKCAKCEQERKSWDERGWGYKMLDGKMKEVCPDHNTGY
jgi:hypothetical protein